MKRKMQFASVFCCCLLGLILSVMQVKAFSLVKEPKDNVWTYRHGGGVPAFSGPFTYYSIGGKTTYCIEPGIHIENDADYLGYEGMIKSPFNATINERMELIGYYGYDYPEHQTLKFRMATQALIWETTGSQTVEFWTEKSGGGKKYNIETEKTTIENLISKHYDKPSFNNTTKETIIGKEITFTDNSNILDEFSVQETSQADARISGNTLYVTPKVSGNIEINLVKKTYTDNASSIFVGKDIVTQKMGYFGLTNKVIANVNVVSNEIRFELSKYDFGGSKNAKGDGTLEGAIYGLYNNNEEKIAELVTDARGMAYYNLPALGTYYVKEIKASRGYLIDSEKHKVVVTSSDLKPKLIVYEQPIQRTVELYKYISEGKTGEVTPEANIKFEFYLKSKNKLQTSAKTNSNGYLNVYLPYGTYIVKQIDVTEGYEKVEDFEIVIDESTTKITKYITNVKEKKEAYLQVNKIDKKSQKIIPLDGIKFKIKNTDTNEYVCQNSPYPSNKQICTFETKKGIFTTPEPLPFGNYALEEVDEKIRGYLWNSEPLNFTINADSAFLNDDDLGNILVINFTNTEVLGEINITKYGESLNIQNNTLSYSDVLISGVIYELYASKDIYTGDGTLLYKKDTLIGQYETQNGNIKITNLNLGEYYLKEIKTLDGYILDMDKHYFTLEYQDQYTEIVQKNLVFKNSLIKGQIRLTKKGDLNNPLANALLAIYNLNNELIYEGKTNAEGLLVLDNLPYGEYYLIEKEAPEGYVLNNEKIAFAIKENEETINLELINKPIIGTLEFQKLKKDTLEGLANAQIEIYNIDNELVYQGETNADGQIILQLKYGKYYLIEKEAPLGYVKNTDKIYFAMQENGEIVELTLENALITNKVIITKKDKETLKLLEGALIEIYNSNNELVYQGQTNLNGEINLELPYGEYYIIEKDAPLGYNKYEDKITISIVNPDETLHIELLDEPITGTLKIIKYDNATSELLKNSEFAIYDENDNLITTGITNDLGELIIENLKYGKYYLVETKAPEGYLLNAGQIDFEIKENKTIVTINVPNNEIPKPLIVNVPKTSDNSNLWLTLIVVLNIFIGVNLIIYDKKR